MSDRIWWLLRKKDEMIFADDGIVDDTTSCLLAENKPVSTQHNTRLRYGKSAQSTVARQSCDSYDCLFLSTLTFCAFVAVS